MGRRGHLFSLGGAPRPYSTVHTPSTVGQVAVGENRMGTRWGVTKIFTVSLLRGSHVAQAGLQLVTATKDDLACLSASTSQVRDGSCVPPHLVSVVLGWNSGLTQLGELCPLSGRPSPGSFIFWSHFILYQASLELATTLLL